MLEDPPLLEIKRDWTRPDLAKLNRFDGAQTGHLVDAMNGRGALNAAIKPILARRPKFIGTAVPVETGPNDNLAILAGVARAKPGDVIVAASDAFDRTAVTGDIVCGLARNAQCRAIVIDGMARDLDGIEEIDFPIFARGITPNSCVKSGPGKVGFATVVGGVLVSPGDIVMGDRDGIVVVPLAMLDEVIETVDAIRAAEGEVLKKVADGMTSTPYIDELLKSDKVRFVD